MILYMQTSLSRKVTSAFIIIPPRRANLRQSADFQTGFHYCLLRPQVQYIYVTSSRVYINTSQHPINHFFLASTFLIELCAPDLVETTWNSFLSWAQNLMGHTQQWYRWAISRVLIITRICVTKIQRARVRTYLLPLKVYFLYKTIKHTTLTALSKGQKRS